MFSPHSSHKHTRVFYFVFLTADPSHDIGGDDEDAADPLAASACCCVGGENRARRAVKRLVEHDRFDGVILFLILLGSIALALEHPYLDPGTENVVCASAG